MIKIFQNILLGLLNSVSSYQGELRDNRTDEEKVKDWQADELFDFGEDEVSPFREVSENKWVKHQIRNQGSSGSCVANALAKIAEATYYKKNGKSIKFSHAPIYMHRKNRGTSEPYGMWVGDAFEIFKKYSSCEENLFPSENKSNAQLDALKLPEDYEKINDLVKFNSYLFLRKDFNLVAKTVNKVGGVYMGIDTGRLSWQKDIPDTKNSGTNIRHGIAIVDAINYKGEDYLVIEDSWGKFGKFQGQRLISKEFFDKYVTSVVYPVELKFDVFEQVVRYVFTKNLNFGMRNSDVKELQLFLQSKGFFPSNVTCTGYYGNVTRKAVYNFQVANKVAPMQELNKLAGKKVGAKTLKVINQINQK